MECAVEAGHPYLNEDYQGRLEPHCRVISDPMNRYQLLVKDLITSRSWPIPHRLPETADFDPAKWYQEMLSQPLEGETSLDDTSLDEPGLSIAMG